MNLYFDLETAPGTGATVERFLVKEGLKHTRTSHDTLRARLSLNATYGQITCIGLGIDDMMVSSLLQPADGSERDIIAAFFDIAENAYRQGQPFRWVGHNICTFDLLWLRMKGLQYQIPLPKCFPRSFQWWDDNIFDTMMELSRGLKPQWVRPTVLALDDVCRAFGLPHDTEDSGEDCPTLWAHGEYERVKKKCEADVVAVRALYQRLFEARLSVENAFSER